MLQVEPDARVLGSKIKREDWTYEQDMVFEHAMAEFDETVSFSFILVLFASDGCPNMHSQIFIIHISKSRG